MKNYKYSLHFGWIDWCGRKRDREKGENIERKGNRWDM